jgi:hypothetical protein
MWQIIMADFTMVLTALNSQASLEHVIENNQGKMDANLREIIEDIRTLQKEMTASREVMDVWRVRTQPQG